MTRLLRSWPFAWVVTVLAHVAVVQLPMFESDERQPLEVVAFELAELPPPPPEPVPPPPPEVKPPGPVNPDPEADPEVTSIESNRPEPAEPDPEPTPLRTGLALDADQLVPDSMGMGVRVGNTDAAGFDADVAPEDLRGFVGGGAGGGTGDVVQNVDNEPELLRAWQPPYPQNMLDAQVEGRVLMRVTVLTNGRAGKASIVDSVHPELDQVALNALKRFRWRPARRHGQRVETSILLAIRFEIKT
jgi:protein TonB